MRKPSTYAVVKLLVYLQAMGAASISFLHIVEVGQRYGLTWEAWIAPFLIDGFAILGTIGRSTSFAESTRRTGFKLMLGAGLVSLVCNVLAGQNIGQRVFGVLVVAGFVTAEWYAAKLHRAPAPAPERKLDPEVAKARAEKAKATKAQRKAEREAAAEAERWASLTPGQRAAETRARKATAPTSPAPAGA